MTSVVVVTVESSVCIHYLAAFEARHLLEYIVLHDSNALDKSANMIHKHADSVAPCQRPDHASTGHATGVLVDQASESTRSITSVANARE